jgi:hypothetical protein
MVAPSGIAGQGPEVDALQTNDAELRADDDGAPLQ